jgi:hypothetical protein
MSIENQSDNIMTTQEEVDHRMSFCGTCEYNILDVIPKCSQCNCPLSSLMLMSFKSCPIGKW